MFTPIDEQAVAATTTTSTPPKTVSGFNVSDNFQLMYTVPEGRKWVGRVGSRNEGSRFGPYITPAGETPSASTTNNLKSMRIVSNSFSSMGASNSYGNHSSWEITLLAGDMIHSYNSSSSHHSKFLGIESDA